LKVLDVRVRLATHRAFAGLVSSAAFEGCVSTAAWDFPNRN
jgi:hypothetical protein